MSVNLFAPLGAGNNVFADAAIGTFGFQSVGFVAASVLQTEVFYDCFGGLNFLGVALLAYHSCCSASAGPSSHLPFIMFTALFAISRAWLLIFLVWRAHKRKGDARFDKVIGNPPLFFVYWMVQACWVYLISLPLLVAASGDSQEVRTNNAQPSSLSSSLSSLSTTQGALLAGFAGGILLEITSDVQKAVWVESGRSGGFCRSGWWYYSRHPNYAGEILQWWCAACLALLISSDGGRSSSWYRWVALVSPLFTMHLLLNLTGTGVWNAEGQNLKRIYESEHRDAYEAYRHRTSPVIPFPPSLYGRLPLTAKRLFFFEWERYVYHPPSDGPKKSL